MLKNVYRIDKNGDETMFSVKKRTLLLIAGIVWFIAGFNVARLGFLSYFMIKPQWYFYIFSIIVFSLFAKMFFKMSMNHTKRIVLYEDYRPFWHFFDLKAYIIMTCMMSMGIGFRIMGIFPDNFVAYFYSGLGCALTLAGVMFFRNYLCYAEIVENLPKTLK